MNEREQRGLVIAAKCRLVRKGDQWAVPSQSGTGNYMVDLEPENQAGPRCTCADHEITGQKCKHIFAVEIVSQRERYADGSSAVVSTVTIKEECRKTYRQSWPEYNLAQTHEKERFLSLLQDLCRGVQEPPAPKKGRKSLPIGDALFACCYKVYSGFSARRFMTDMRGAVAKGYVKTAMHFNSILNYMEDESLAPILKALIVESSRPLATVEVDFACDSTGFMTTRYDRWFDYKYGKPKAQQEWVKLHFTCGVKTNCVVAVVIKDKNAADTKQLPDMAKQTAKNFKVRDFTADMAYGSNANFEAIAATGGTGYIPFKSNATGGAGGLYEKMFHYFQFKRDEFLSHYHKRSNAESTVSMIKRKFGDSVRSKTDAAMLNETLAKVLCHNIVVLIHEMYELGIEPVFWADSAAQK
jgi:transposase